MPTLVQTLFNGPLDIVGDVHGEMHALSSLLNHLGYDSNGHHPEGRRLVFVGDLTDRGPDSPAVVDFVAALVKSGLGQCVLGNHDFNLLLGQRKNDNGWFYGEIMTRDGEVVPQVLADETSRQTALDLFAKLPIALERRDLRVIHACWNEKMINIARRHEDVAELYESFHAEIEASFPDLDADENEKDLRHQNDNPVKRLTSGPEQLVKQSFVAGGVTRNLQRVQWWKDYRDTFCIFGHYSIPDGDPRGNECSFCIDYGVGKRWTERRDGTQSGFRLKLAALRWPERQVVFDEGRRESLQ